MIGLFLLGFLVLNEWRVQQPIMPLRLLANRERAGASVARILYLGGMLGFWFFLTQYLEIVRGYSPIEAGIAFLPMTICNFIIAVLAPRLTRRFGNARLLAGGVVITLIEMAWLSRLTADSSYMTSVALTMVLLGIGQCASLGPLTAAGIGL